MKLRNVNFFIRYCYLEIPLYTKGAIKQENNTYHVGVTTALQIRLIKYDFKLTLNDIEKLSYRAMHTKL